MSQILTVDVLDWLNVHTTGARGSKVDLPGGRTFLYNDGLKKYEEVPRDPDTHRFRRVVSNVESFGAYIIEQAKRMFSSSVDPITGAGISVIFGMKGAECLLEDKEPNYTTISYQRLLSQQWQFLRDRLEQPLTHRELVSTLAGLKPSLGDSYNSIATAYRKLTFTENAEIKSQPFLDDNGQGGSAFKIEYARAGADGSIKAPSSFTLRLQYTQDSSKYYDLEIDLDMYADKDRKLMFKLYAYQFKNVAAQAAIDEIADLRALLAKDLPSALVIVNMNQ